MSDRQSRRPWLSLFRWFWRLPPIIRRSAGEGGVAAGARCDLCVGVAATAGGAIGAAIGAIAVTGVMSARMGTALSCESAMLTCPRIWDTAGSMPIAGAAEAMATDASAMPIADGVAVTAGEGEVAAPTGRPGAWTSLRGRTMTGPASLAQRPRSVGRTGEACAQTAASGDHGWAARCDYGFIGSSVTVSPLVTSSG